jgi:cell division protein FtsB
MDVGSATERTPFARPWLVACRFATDDSPRFSVSEFFSLVLRRPLWYVAPHSMPTLLDSPLVKPLPYSRNRRNLWVRRALIFATVVVFVDAVVGKSGLAQSFRAEHEYESAQAELDALRAQNAALTDRVRRLDHDAGAIEGLAREELGFLRRGEIVFVVNRSTDRLIDRSPIDRSGDRPISQ